MYSGFFFKSVCLLFGPCSLSAEWYNELNQSCGIHVYFLSFSYITESDQGAMWMDTCMPHNPHLRISAHIRSKHVFLLSDLNTTPLGWTVESLKQ